MEIIKIRVVKNSSWTHEYIRKEVEKAFQEFRRQFQVGYKIIEIKEWKPIRFPTYILNFLPFKKKMFDIVINLLMKKLWKIKKEDTEIIIGFSGKLKIRHKETFGYTDTKGYILIGVCRIPHSYTILHEVGHCFGAEDKDGTGIRSVMNSKETKTCYDFDDENRAIILKVLSNRSHN